MKPAKIVRAFYNDDDVLLSAVKTIKENKYHIEESYPVFNRSLPLREEVQEVLEFTEKLFTQVCKRLNIDEGSVKQ